MEDDVESERGGGECQLESFIKSECCLVIAIQLKSIHPDSEEYQSMEHFKT